MKYFTLQNSTVQSEVGKIYPQCDSVPIGYDYSWLEQPNSMVLLSNDFFPDLNPDLIFSLHKRAKLTDVVSPSNISAKGLLVNEKVKNILEQYNLTKCKFYPAVIKVDDFEYAYFWLHLVKENLVDIDFKKSQFEITNLVNVSESNINITSWEHFIELKMSLPLQHIRAKKIVIENDVQKDLLYFPYIYSHIFIGESLAIELVQKNVTGIAITDQNVLPPPAIIS